LTFRRVIVRHGLPYAAICGLYLVAFWPGILSVDSLDQWAQLRLLRITPYHPPAHTLTNWLITRLWLSPAAVALAQIAAMTLALCAVLWQCARRGAPAWLRWLTALWLAIVPANGFLTITLWKDIPYAIAHVLVAALSLRLADPEDDALRRPAFLAALVATLTAMAVYRHNGLPVAAAFLVYLLIVVARRERPRVLAVAALTAVGIVTIQQTITVLFHPGPIPAALRYQTPIHQVAAVVASDEPIDPGDEALIARLMPLQEWKSRYRCTGMVPLITPGGLDYAALDREEAAFLRLWGRWLMAHPAIVAKHQACVTGMLWRPGAPLVFAETAAPLPYGAELGVETRPLSATLHAWLLSVYRFSLRRSPQAIFWGPAVHWWVVCVCALAVGLRRRSGRALLPFLPAIAHTLVLMLLLPSSEFRLQYPVYLIGILSPLMTAALWWPAARAQRAVDTRTARPDTEG
jgi:hypothetical protein